MTSSPTQPSDVLRVDDPRELVVLAAHTLGFRPTESLVAIGLRERGRTGVVARVDLSATRDPGLLAALADHLVADGALSAVVLVHSEDPDDDTGDDGGGGLPHRAAVESLGHQLALRGVGPVQASLVGRGVLRCYAEESGCCPAGGIPLEEAGTQVAARLVATGSAVMADQSAWRGALAAALAPVSAARRRAVERAARAPLGAGEPADVLGWWCDALGTATAAAAAGPGLEEVVEALLAPVPAGRLLAALADRRLRDAVLLSLVPGAGAAVEELLAGEEGPATRAALEGVFGGPPGAPAGPAPDADVLRAAQALLRALVRRAGRERRAEPLAVLAWLAWWQGAGPEAAVHAELALRADSGHALASLVLQTVDRGIPPGWARTGR